MLVLPLHIHTRLEKLKFFVFSPNRTWKIYLFGRHGHTGRGVWVLTAPCDQDTTPYGSKPLLWKRIVYHTIVGRKNEKKTNISPFPATHTYIKLTFVSFFFNFFILNLSLGDTLISGHQNYQKGQNYTLLEQKGWFLIFLSIVDKNINLTTVCFWSKDQLVLMKISNLRKMSILTKKSNLTK